MSMYRVRTVFTGLQGSPYLSTHYFDTGGDSTQTGANFAADAVGDYWNGIDAELDLKMTWATDSEVVVIDEATGSPLAAWACPVQTGAGAKSGDSAPPFTQALARWSTNTFIGGRRIRGRTFVPGMTETNTAAGGTPAVVLQNTIASSGNAMIGNPDCTLVVWSRLHGIAVPATFASCWSQYAVLRSRRD